ncbi:34792_t:CDS:2, partial [Gigaspora margarita]
SLCLLQEEFKKCRPQTNFFKDVPHPGILKLETESKLGIPICKICKMEFSKLTSTSTLARHLNIHNIVALKQGKKLLNSNSYPKIEQQEQTDLVVRWITCDLQLFRVVEGEEWRDMISKFDS